MDVAMGSSAAELIPKERYVSSEFADKEWHGLWAKSWLLACPERELSQVGAYVTVDVGRESVVLLRNPRGDVAAFANVCPHRGNRIIQDERGSAPVLRCGYHGWTFDLDGSQQHVPDAHAFPEPVCSGGLRLARVRCELALGHAWICLGPDPPPLAEHLGRMGELLRAYQLDAYALTEATTVEFDCNWKVFVDGVNETYHLQACHPQLLGFVDDTGVKVEFFGAHSRFAVRFGVPSRRLSKRTLTPELVRMLRDAGLDPEPFRDRVDEVRAALAQARRAQGHYGDLDDSQLTDGYNHYVFPNVVFDMHADRAIVLRALPHASDPGKMRLDEWTYERPRDRATVPRRRRVQYPEESINPVLDQDARHLIQVQKGMVAPSFRGLLLGEHEVRIRHMHETLMSLLNG